jgi:hypothetical protein
VSCILAVIPFLQDEKGLYLSTSLDFLHLSVLLPVIAKVYDGHALLTSQNFRPLDLGAARIQDGDEYENLKKSKHICLKTAVIFEDFKRFSLVMNFSLNFFAVYIILVSVLDRSKFVR